MSDCPRIMRLTKELVDRCHRVIEDAGPEERYDYFGDPDFDQAVETVLAGKPVGPVWLFAYGSLIWKAEFPTVETRRAVAHGWQRAFSMRSERFRGAPERPGYLRCLGPGGSCDGGVVRLGLVSTFVGFRGEPGTAAQVLHGIARAPR